MNIVIAYLENLGNVVGGLEKLVCEFGNEFVQRGHSVTIITFDETQQRPYYYLNEKVSVINLQLKTKLNLSYGEKLEREIYRVFGKKYVRCWKFLWKQHHGVSNLKMVLSNIRPDVIISLETMTSAEVINQDIKIPLITALQNDPEVCCCNLPSREIDALEKSNIITVFLPSFVEKMARFVANKRIISIPCVIPQHSKKSNIEKGKGIYKIINVARLNKRQKRQEIIIKAFSLLAQKYPDWIVELWGNDTSNYKQELEDLVRTHHLEKRVFLKGTTHNLRPVFQDADVFAFPSKYEGFGLALGEAMSAGLPAVGFKSCSAVNELIKDGETGFLAEDGVEAYAAALEELMKNPEKRIAMGKAAHESMKAYRAEQVWDQWEGLLQTVVSK